MRRTLVASFVVLLPYACGGTVAGGTASGDSGGSGGGPPNPNLDPCATSAQSACEGDVLLTCDKGTVNRFDCASGSGLPRICTWLGGRVSAFACAARIGDACSVDYQGEPVILDCAGDETGCLEHHDGTSECVEHLGVCPPGPPSGHEHCVGTYRMDPCDYQQPLGHDCADYGSDARCAESGDQAWCENIPIGSPCNADWDGTTTFTTGSLYLELRCASGATCTDATVGPDGLNIGACRIR